MTTKVQKSDLTNTNLVTLNFGKFLFYKILFYFYSNKQYFCTPKQTKNVRKFR